MIVKLNNGAVREIKKAEPMVEKRFEFNGNSYRMIAKANSNKEDMMKCRKFLIHFLLKAMRICQCMIISQKYQLLLILYLMKE